MKKKVYVVFKNYIKCNLYRDAVWIKENGYPVNMPIENYPISKKRGIEACFHKENIKMERFSKDTELTRHARHEFNEGMTFIYSGHYHSLEQVSATVKKVDGMYFVKIDDRFVHISDTPKIKKQKGLDRDK